MNPFERRANGTKVSFEYFRVERFGSDPEEAFQSRWKCSCRSISELICRSAEWVASKFQVEVFKLNVSELNVSS